VEQKQGLREKLRAKEYWTTKEIRVVIKEEYGIEYSYEQISRIVRQFGMRLQKPYPQDYRRPEEAQEILENQLRVTFELLLKEGIEPEEIAIGMMDESSPQTTANTVRVWSFQKVRIKKNTTKIRANTLGYYTIKGNDTVVHLSNSKSPEICRALEEIKQANQVYRAIIVILDNFNSHKSKQVEHRARELGIYLVRLPKYSPDLNPIEIIWRAIKRVISLEFVENKESLRDLIEKSFREFSKKLSYARWWISRFFNPVWNFYTQNYGKLCS
jgi:transposase